jgi:hypothetical protein
MRATAYDPEIELAQIWVIPNPASLPPKKSSGLST